MGSVPAQTCPNPPKANTLGAIALGILEESGLEGYEPFSPEAVYAIPQNAFPAQPGALLGAATPALVHRFSGHFAVLCGFANEFFR